MDVIGFLSLMQAQVYSAGQVSVLYDRALGFGNLPYGKICTLTFLSAE